MGFAILSKFVSSTCSTKEVCASEGSNDEDKLWMVMKMMANVTAWLRAFAGKLAPGP